MVVWAPVLSVATAPMALSGSNALCFETAAGQRERLLRGAGSCPG